MVNTRSQNCDNNTIESTRMSDNEGETSFPEVLTREQMIEFESHDILNRQNNTERAVIGRRFNEMNRQIGEITDLVLAFTQQISSNPREGNQLNTVTTNANSRSDNGSSLSNRALFLHSLLFVSWRKNALLRLDLEATNCVCSFCSCPSGKLVCLVLDLLFICWHCFIRYIGVD